MAAGRPLCRTGVIQGLKRSVAAWAPAVIALLDCKVMAGGGVTWSGPVVDRVDRVMSWCDRAAVGGARHGPGIPGFGTRNTGLGTQVRIGAVVRVTGHRGTPAVVVLEGTQPMPVGRRPSVGDRAVRARGGGGTAPRKL